MFKQFFTILRSRCALVYVVGEHGTAVLYAACEFINLHNMLILFSFILLIGIVLVGLDKLLTLVGM